MSVLGQSRHSGVGAFVALARRVRPRWAAVVLGTGIVAVLAACWSTTLDRDGFVYGNNRLLDLNAERNLGAFFAAGLLVAAAAAAFAWASAVSADGDEQGRRAGAVFALCLAFMAVDELASIHERLEARIGIDWQVLYLPVVVVCGLAWLLCARRVPRWPSAALLAGGAGAWFAAQVFEKFQYDAHDVLVHPWTIIPEEGLEMLGTLLFGLAFLTALTPLTPLSPFWAPFRRHAADSVPKTGV